MSYTTSPLIIGLLCFVLTLVTTVSTVAQDIDSVKPADVLVRVEHVQRTLDILGFEMGKPKDDRRSVKVTGAAPREVYFQALTLFRKADRFAFEHIRERQPEPTPPRGEIAPFHVKEVVNLAADRLEKVKQKYGITQTPESAERVAATTPSDVFVAIVDANRQLNLLLDRRVAPADVYREVTVAMAFSSELLKAFPNADRKLQTPEYIPGKRPADVYQRLAECYGVLRTIADQSGVAMLKLDMLEFDSQVSLEATTPSDVMDMASLIVSEVSFLHSKLDDAKAPFNAYFPGRKFPSHVYQRVGMLESQLLELERLSKQNPDWLQPQ